MVHSFHRLSRNQQGFAALFGVITFSLLLVTISISSSRLAASELRQASEVDHSARALKAAEAGLEEALMRIDADLNEDRTLAEIFPEGATAPPNGDMAMLLDADGLKPNVLSVEQDDGGPGGAMSWRNRVVRESSFNKIGVQVKDEIIEMDLSRLNELDDNGEICGTSGSNVSCSGGPIHPHVTGVEYCPTNLDPPTLPNRNPRYEWIITSYAANDPANINSNRYIIDSPVGLPPGFQSHLDVDDQCYRYEIPASHRNTRRYIFRIKPLFETAGVSITDSRLFSEYKVSYRTELLTNPSLDEVAIADGSVLVDVTGESAGVRRRIIAKKQRNGRVLGVFDYLLYSGDPAKPLCKAGVLYEVDDENGFSYNLNNCDNSVDDPVQQPNVVTPGVNYGCTDENSPNYDPNAFVDDGTCNYEIVFEDGGSQTPWPVPSGITQITATVCGAEGGLAPSRPPELPQSPRQAGGKGGCVTATIPVTPGETLYINIGGAGSTGTGGVNNGGANGGGRGGSLAGASGGGASDIRRGGSALANRVMVGGGGGGGDTGPDPDGIGGHGGWGTPVRNTSANTAFANGQNGRSNYGYSVAIGGGSSCCASGGSGGSYSGFSGSAGSGGAVSSVFSYENGGGGGGGYFGGGGGSPYGSGAGGSSFGPANATFLSGDQGQSGNGRVTITY